MSDIFEVRLDVPNHDDVSALVLAHWACPGPKERDLRDRLYLSLCSWFIRDRAAYDPEWAMAPQMLIPNQACRAEGDIRRDMRTLKRRMVHRAEAGFLVMPFLMAAETAIVPKLAKGVARLSINEMAELLCDQAGYTETANIKSRILAPSLPVIHLCSAWATMAQDHQRDHGVGLDLAMVLQRTDLLATLLYRAQLHEPLLERSKLKIAPERLTRFRMVGSSS